MPLNLPYSINPTNPVPVDGWSGPYTASTIQAALIAADSAIPSAVRFISMEVRIVVNDVPYKYWYYGGVSASNLLPFNSPLNLTTYGNSGSSTYSNNILNIPTYTLGGLGGQPLLNGSGIVYSNNASISYISGAAQQYVRGDGTLGDFPTSAGGGGGSIFYFNNGITELNIDGITYSQLSKIPNQGTESNIVVNNNGTFSYFLTAELQPGQTSIPPGVWTFQIYFSTDSNSIPSVYATLYKYDGVTFSYIAKSQDENIDTGSTIDLHYFSVSVPQTTLSLTDRIAIIFSVVNLSSNKVLTMYTQDGRLSNVNTTFPTGIATLNGLNIADQYFSIGNSGTDFNIISATHTHIFNIPNSSSVNRGLLTSTDWDIFNNKQDFITNPVTGTGDSGQIAIWSGTNSLIGNSGLSFSNNTLNVANLLISPGGVINAGGNDTTATYVINTSIVPYTSQDKVDLINIKVLTQPNTNYWTNANVVGVDSNVSTVGYQSSHVSTGTTFSTFRSSFNSYWGNINKAIAFYATSPTGGQGISEYYGVYLSSKGNISNSIYYGLFQQETTALNYFAGYVSIGMSASTANRLQVSGAVLATSYKVNNGTFSQFLKADGSLDSTTYISNTGGTMSGTLVTSTGTLTVASLRIPSGLLLSTASSGVIENNGTRLYYTDSSNVRRTLSFTTDAPVAGSNSQVQFNNNGSFGATSGFSWDNVNGRLGVNRSPTLYTLEVDGNIGIKGGSVIVSLLNPSHPSIGFGTTGLLNKSWSIVQGNLNISQVNYTTGDNSALFIQGNTLTLSTSTSLISMIQSWTTSGNPTAILMNITNSSSGNASKLLDFQVNSSSVFNIDKNGSESIILNGITQSVVNGLSLLNNTIGTTSSMIQYSPAIRFLSNIYNNNGTTSTFNTRMYVKTTQRGNSSIQNLTFEANRIDNGLTGSYSELFSLGGDNSNRVYIGPLNTGIGSGFNGNTLVVNGTGVFHDLASSGSNHGIYIQSTSGGGRIASEWNSSNNYIQLGFIGIIYNQSISFYTSVNATYQSNYSNYFRDTWTPTNGGGGQGTTMLISPTITLTGMTASTEYSGIYYKANITGSSGLFKHYAWQNDNGDVLLSVSSGTVLVGTSINNGVDKLQVNGSVISSGYKTSTGTSNDVLLADGTTITKGVLANSSASAKNICMVQTII